MSDLNDQLPIKAERDSLLVSRAASHPTTDRMVNDLLSRGRGKDLATQRYQVGDFFLCLPDYQQILLWSEYFDIDPITLVSILDGTSPHLSGLVDDFDGLLDDPVLSNLDNRLRIVEGKIIHVFWNIKDIGGMPPADWVRDLHIQSFLITGNTGQLECLVAPKLPSLRVLEYYACKGARSLDLSGCPNIESLTCRGTGYGDIEELKFAGCKTIKHLDCSRNQIAYLDLTGLDNLEVLCCSENKLDSIDLSVCQSLRHLNCRSNQLTSLDLTGLPLLETIDCSSNKLTTIDLRSNPKLESLSISENLLTRLDTLFLKHLAWLQCYSNSLDYDDFREKNRVGERFNSDYGIENFNLGVRAYNILRRFGIHSIQDLRQKSFEDIRGLRHMNEKSAQEVIHLLEHQAPWTFSSK